MPKEPRDKKRIPEVLDLIKSIWEKDPDLRLMQLLGNLFRYDFDPYYVEDDELVKKLKETYKVDS